MAPASPRTPTLFPLFFVLALDPAPAPALLPSLTSKARTFQLMHIDFPRSNFAPGFRGYCNGLMAYVRAQRESWQCPERHFVLHAPSHSVRALCARTDSFCEDFGEFCTLSRKPLPVTTCARTPGLPPSVCRYNATVHVQSHKIWLLCSSKFEGFPMDIIGVS
ncbi:probable inactive ribonuclease-like protein 13 [Tachyglossus aculeatus]|uniref:probable inactive ribonuclease-like protein 13 n=1 Tax=Tachyglossus aculeatus TaxID=9261 RepID=UPI0018F66AB5|nr:probable inactive ribonuclease-like protein 13 [Tachyglossus aculeatus]